MENYRVLIAASAARELEAIDGKANRQRVARAIGTLAQNPRGPGSEKLSGRGARYRIRSGDFRVVYSVDDRGHTVDVVKIGHRREVYR